MRTSSFFYFIKEAFKQSFYDWKVLYSMPKYFGVFMPWGIEKAFSSSRKLDKWIFAFSFFFLHSKTSNPFWLNTQRCLLIQIDTFKSKPKSHFKKKGILSFSLTFESSSFLSKMTWICLSYWGKDLGHANKILLICVNNYP